MMVLVVKKQYYGFSELVKSSRLRIGNFIMKVRRIRTALSGGHHPSHNALHRIVQIWVVPALRPKSVRLT